MRKSRWLLGFAVATISVGGCKDAAEEQRIADRAECGHDSGREMKAVSQVADIIDVPEFHDCQRFIVEDSKRLVYDSLFAIYASQRLDSLEPRLGPVLVPSAPPSVVTLAPQVRTALAAVVHAEGAYPRLGIKPGTNCLYVWREYTGAAPAAALWSARMISGVSDANCPDLALSDLPDGTNLRVDRRQIEDFASPSDYPPVARWDWDAGNRAQYIGVTCGAAWCEVFNGTLNSSPPLPVSSTDSREVRRVRLIKGWYDQQLLATEGSPGKLVPSKVMGTIVPDVRLGRFTLADFEAREMHVADIGLVSEIGPADPVLAKYQAKFNFAATTVDRPVTMGLRKPSQPVKGLWEAGIISSSAGPRVIRAVMRRPVDPAFTAKKYRVPGVARWRWMRTDEGSWIRCDEGCCEMSNYVF